MPDPLPANVLTALDDAGYTGKLIGPGAWACGGETRRLLATLATR